MANKDNRASRQEIVTDSKENIVFLKTVLIPRLKRKDGQPFSLAEVREISTLFYNAGACINALSKVVANPTLPINTREEARNVMQEYDALCDEAIELMK